MYTKLKSLLLFSILPLFYALFLFTSLNSIEFFHLDHTDPIYAYLMNGTNLAGGHFEIGHTDHPGTPMQCLIALIVFIKHLITGHGITYQDVILDPESYLRIICIVQALLFVLITYLTGNYVFKHTRSIPVSLFFQLTPAFNDRIFIDAALPCAEYFIITGCTFFIAFIYLKALHKPEEEDTSGKKYRSIFFGLFSALLIASKFTCIPLILIPLFLLKDIKERLKYFISVIFFFTVFIFPALPKIGNMFNWVFDLFLHEGHYGSGKADILNMAAFKSSISQSFTTDIIFTFLYLITSIAFIVTLVNYRKPDKLNPVYQRGIIGVWLTFTFTIIMVSKHYLFGYYIPIQCFSAITLIVSFQALFPFIRQEFIPIVKRLAPLFPILIAFVLIFNCSIHTLFGRNSLEPVLQVKNFLESKKNTPIIYTDNCGVSDKPALLFGIIYSGALRSTYFQFTKMLYPAAYFYEFDTKKIVLWDLPVLSPEIYRQYSKVLVYFKQRNHDDEIADMNNLCMWNGKKIADYKSVYEEPEIQEHFYEISSDTAALKKMFTRTESIHCDMEKLTTDKSQFLTDNEIYRVKSANLITTDEHHSGINAIKLNKYTTYSADMDINISPGDFVTISIWGKATNNKAVIVFSPTDASFYTCSSAIVNTDKDGWKQLVCKYQVPFDFKGKTAKFYMYYTGKSECWLDDLEINIYQVK